MDRNFHLIFNKLICIIYLPFLKMVNFILKFIGLKMLMTDIDEKQLREQFIDKIKQLDKKSSA